jgi:gamma-glutamyl hercynylcysteine S-oxide synthase
MESRQDQRSSVAFFNGVGWESWENILGIWNGITPRAAEATRKIATIERAFAPFFVSGAWQPMVPRLRYGVYASRWPQGEQTLFAVVNRNEYDVDGDQMFLQPRECAVSIFTTAKSSSRMSGMRGTR